ncbi:MAG: hypothetical protein Q7I97_06605 [Thermovirgaceae bacterium]|nr:hypothetical protein [Thermovirgaceae bacterium]
MILPKKDTPENPVLRGALSRLFELAVHVLWPVSCPVCGMTASPACPGCLAGLAEKSRRMLCAECMRPFPCPSHPGSVPLRYLTSFGGVSRDLVHLLKYGSRRELGRLMGRTMGEAFPRMRAALLVPVPLHAGSERAFNQSLELARGMADVWKAGFEDSLEWKISRPSQVGLPSSERKNIPKNAMQWKGQPPSGRTIWIVDDVCTTGATLRSAIQAVTASGSRVAGAFTWAMTPGV